MISEYFDRKEFACKCGCGFDVIDAELLIVLENVRTEFARPVEITSGCRCKLHNQLVGGVVNSQHLIGKAADIVVYDFLPQDIAEFLNTEYPNKYGIGQYDDFTHVDVRLNRVRW